MNIEVIHNGADFSNSVVPENNILLFVSENENNEPVLKYKDSSGEFHTFTINTPVSSDTSDTSDISISSDSSIDPNLLPGNIKYNVTIEGVTGTFTGDGDATASDMLSGKKAYVKGSLVTGSIQTVQATLSANVVTVPVGYIATSQTLTVPEAPATTVSSNVVTTPVGYVPSQRITSVGSAIEGTTYTPTSSSYTVPAGSYLNGAIVIEGSENLIESNIKKGVTIFNVSGTYEGVITSDTSDTPDATATAGDILAGKTAYGSAGILISGTIPTVSASLAANVTTVPVGYIASSQTLTVPEAGSITTNNLTVTVPVGYIASSRTVTLTDANLIADNIKDGIAIFGVTGTYSGGGGGGGGSESSGESSGVFDLILVTTYQTQQPQAVLNDTIVLSGFPSPVEEWDPDFSAYNGTYEVTQVTASNRDWKARVYRKGNYTLKYKIYNENEDYDKNGDYWSLGSSDSSTDMWIVSSNDLSSGQLSWISMDYYDYVNCTAACTTTTYPAVAFSLSGKRVTSFNALTQKYVITPTITSMQGFYGDEPVVNKIFALTNSYLIGHPVAEANIPAIPTGFTSNTSIAGYTIDQSSGDGPYPEAWCLFNLDTTTDEYAWWTGRTDISAASPAWFSIHVPQAFIPSGIFIMNEVKSPENFRNATFQGSNDGTTWTDLLTITDSPDEIAFKQTFYINTNTAYSYFRMYFTASYARGVSVQAFTIYRTQIAEEA